MDSSFQFYRPYYLSRIAVNPKLLELLFHIDDHRQTFFMYNKCIKGWGHSSTDGSDINKLLLRIRYVMDINIT